MREEMKNSNSNQRQIFDFFLETFAYLESLSDSDKITTFLVERLAEIFQVNKVSYMAFDEIRQDLMIKASLGLNPIAKEKVVKLGELFVGWVAKEKKPLLVKNIDVEFPHISKERLTRYSTKSFVIMPVIIRDKVIGVFSLTDKKEVDTFNDTDIGMLKLITHYFALCIENIHLVQNSNVSLNLDSLTNLFNHRYFQEQLSEEIYRSERYHRSFSLLMLDIDNFASYNQSFGYSSGDSALQQIARIIKENIRKIDFPCRYGQEEFVIILPETRLKEAGLVAEKIRDKVESAIFSKDRTTSLEMSKLTVSVGVAEHRVGLSKDELINRMIMALGEAQEKGKNRVCLFK